MRMPIYSPLREKDVFKGTQTESYGAATRACRCGSRASGSGRRAAAPSDTVYSEPGTFYVSVAADDSGRNLEADQFDTLIDLQVTGNMIATPTPTATAKPAATAEPGRDGRARLAATTRRRRRARDGDRARRSRSAAWWASASGGCGRSARSRGCGEVAAERPDQRAEHEHDAEHALALGVAEQRVLEQAR